MATIQGQTGPQVLTDGVNTTARTGRTGELNTSDAHGRYQEAVYRGNVYSLSTAAAGPTGYVGAGGGTPLLSIHNPTGSGKNFVLLGVSVAISVTAGTAGLGYFAVWAGPSVTPTGTASVPVNQLTWNASGSVGRGSINAALTSSTALTNVFPLATYYWATAAGNFMAPSYFDIGGLVIASPGTQFNVGLSVVPTSTTITGSMVWEEIAV